MKTAEELDTDLQNRFNTNPYVKHQKMYGMQKSGNVLDDFCKFTDYQSGGKSDDPNDWYFKNTVNPAPPIPDTDGHYYHTVRDCCWQLFKTVVSSDPVRFYNMSDADREVVVKYMISFGNISKSDIVNAMFWYAVWGTGNCHMEQVYYGSWYKTAINDDIDSLGVKAVLDRVTDIRLYNLSTFITTASFPGQPAGVLNIWRLLSSYC